VSRARRPGARRAGWAVAAAVIGTAAALGAGYSVAGPTGLVDAAALAALGVLVLARGTIRAEEPAPVRLRRNRRQPGRRPAVRAADFPAYASIVSDLEWARMSRRHYEHAMRPMLARLAASLGRPQAVADLGPGPGNALDPDGPGADLATLERIVARLEGEP
jgi:hypothetical protein